jgi:hypothetical protein
MYTDAFADLGKRPTLLPEPNRQAPLLFLSGCGQAACIAICHAQTYIKSSTSQLFNGRVNKEKTMRKTIIPLLFLAALAPLESLCPQALVQPGTRIRVTHRCTPAEGGEALLCLPREDARPGRTAGALVAVRSDTLLLGRGATPVTVLFPLAAVSRVEIYSGQRSHWLAGAGIGALAGMVTGWVAGYVATRGDESGIAAAIFPVLDAVLGTSVGLCTGAVVGLFVKSDQWTPIPVRRLGVTPTTVHEHSAGVSLRLGF